MNSFDKIVAGGDCLGCGLCAALSSGKAVMKEDLESGYLIPVQISEEPVVIDRLYDMCPGVSLKLNAPSKRDCVYGYYRRFGFAHATDPKVRWKGSSGGALTAVLISLLNRRKVSGVLQVASDLSNPTKNSVFFSRTIEEVMHCCGSRYAPSSLLENVGRVLEAEEQIAVVGKPCDIAALKQLVVIKPELTSKVFCTLSFFCMGLPSYRSTDRLLRRMGVSGDDNVSEFRYRGHGWPGKAVVVTDEGSHEVSYQASWGGILGRDLKARCKLCPDGMGEYADIVFGDAWYLRDHKPVFEERAGRSLLFTRTELGDDLVSAAISDKYLAFSDDESDIATVRYMQPAQYSRKLSLLPRLASARVFGGKKYRFSGFKILRKALKAGPRTCAAAFLSAAKRFAG